ncbi:MAG: GHKL domain-containing protein [Bacteroidia bacterium]|nr:GHKL domain-containing protein [Bacteroidia bacterium]
MKEEKELAQEQALSIAHENAEIIKQQNVVLEQKVIERTTTLTETNNNLALTLNELKQTQTQLVESEKMASLGQLTAGIAHEINNPINFVTSNVKPLERDIHELYKLQEETEQLLGENEESLIKVKQLKDELDFDYLKTEIAYLIKGINEGSTRTAEIVKGLRIFSRVDEDDIKLASINEGLDSTIIIANNQLNNKIVIIKEFANLPQIECFPGKLNQVFLNLISNGIYAIKQKFVDVDGGAITIKTTLTEEDVIISIADNGTGMSDETKAKLFEPFFTTKPVGDGTGLGLSIVYNTIKKHNGTLTVDTALGIGTTFTITIPQKYSNGEG